MMYVEEIFRNSRENRKIGAYFLTSPHIVEVSAKKEAVMGTMGWIISMLSGILMSLQGVFNTQVNEQSSLWVSTVWAQFSALLVCLLCWGFADRASFMLLKEVTPRYLLAGGILGAGITVTVILGMKWIGPAQSTVFIVVAQMVFSWLVEKCGWFGVEKTPFSWLQMGGILLAAAGLIMIRLAGEA